MYNKPHVVWILANCNTAPYFNWFAEKAAASKNIKLSVVCMYHEKPLMIEDMKRFGWECHWLKYDPNKRKIGLLKNVFGLTKLLKKIKPDVIHSHLFDDSLVAMIAGKLTNINKRIVTKGDTGFHYKYTPKWMIFDKLINRLSTQIVAISNESHEFILDKEKAKSSKVITIHHGIPIHLYQDSNPEFIESFKSTYDLHNSYLVGTVSRFIEWKGYKDILKVAEQVIPKIPNVKFLLIGSGSQKEEIIELIKAKKMEDHFCLPGYIQPINMPSVYSLMNVYLHAATLEPFGFVIAEALASGLPVVSTPTGAARDVIITGENGWLVEYNRIDQFCDHLLYLYSKKPTLPLKAAQDTAVDNYNFNLMYDNYLNLYLQK